MYAAKAFKAAGNEATPKAKLLLLDNSTFQVMQDHQSNPAFNTRNHKLIFTQKDRHTEEEKRIS